MEFNRKRVNNDKEIDLNIKIENNEASAKDFIEKGQLNLQKNNLNQALLDFSSAIDLAPVSSSYFLRARVSHNLELYMEAISDYDQAALGETLIKDIFFFRGTAYLSLANFEKALEDFSTAINLQPNDYNNLLYRGLTYEKVGSYEKAIQDYSLAISKSEHNYEAYFRRGKLYLRMGDERSALRDFDSSLKLNSKIKNEQDLILKEFYKQKRKLELQEEKKEQLKRENKLRRKEVQKREEELVRLIKVASSQEKLGEKNLAIEAYTKALIINNNNAELLFRRGRLLWEIGEKDKGLIDLRKAGELDEKFKAETLVIIGVDAAKSVGKMIGKWFKGKKKI